MQLTGTMQSWGSTSRFGQRDTERCPTRSGLIGMIAAALGRARTDPISDLADLQFLIREDRAGRLMRDFHTVGGGLARESTVPTAEGKRRNGNTTTVVSDRYYLADAAFTVAATGPDRLIESITEALHRPRWPLGLGRRSCPPEGPFLLGPTGNPVAALEAFPLARNQPRPPTDDLVEVTFYADHPAVADAAVVGEVGDDPISFAPGARAYQTRALYRWTRWIHHELCGGMGAAYLDRITAHQRKESQ
jgi:CRISPR system Cascade subunit CasD